MKDPKKNAFTFIFITLLVDVIGFLLAEVLYTQDNND